MRTQGQVTVLERSDGLTPEAAFDKFLDHRETHKDITAATHDTYISRFRLFAAFLREEGVTDIRAVTTDLLEKYFSRLRNRTDLRAKNSNGAQLSARSIHSHFISLRAIFRFLHVKKHIDENLFRSEDEGGVVVRRPSRRQKMAPKREVVQQIINVFDPTKPPAIYKGEDFGHFRRRLLTARNRAMLVCMAGLGLRTSEVLGLRMDQIDWKGQTVTFKAKGDRERQDRMDFTDDVKAVLLDYLSVREDMEVMPNAEAFFFLTFDGRVMDRDALRRLFLTIENVTCYRLTPHALRYFAGTEFYRKTKDLVLTQRFLRHRNVQTTVGYLGLDSDEVREKTLTNSPVAGLLRR
jgi:site-specific recombinase XerD